ncbi:hypothetical protein ABID56_001643 [Alkalibacillus flavidus]|uniref:Uncharacterized protein n=1 Tax=Alkalibacillus flavidus TaxID=546021 RepID=A0ABV2KVE6_9BACI
MKQWFNRLVWNRVWKRIVWIIILLIIISVSAIVIWVNQHPLTDYIQAEQETIDQMRDHLTIEQPDKTYIQDQLISAPSISDLSINVVGRSDSDAYDRLTSVLMSTHLNAERSMNPEKAHALYDFNLSTANIGWLNGRLYQNDDETLVAIRDWMNDTVGFDHEELSFVPTFYSHNRSRQLDLGDNVWQTAQTFLNHLRELDIDRESLTDTEDKITILVDRAQANEWWLNILEYLKTEELLSNEQVMHWENMHVAKAINYEATYQDSEVHERTWSTTVSDEMSSWDIELNMKTGDREDELTMESRLLVTSDAGDTVLDARFDSVAQKSPTEDIETTQSLIVEYPDWDFADGVRVNWGRQATATEDEFDFDIAIANEAITRPLSGTIHERYSSSEGEAAHDTTIVLNVEDESVFDLDIPLNEWEVTVEREHEFDAEASVQPIERSDVVWYDSLLLEKWQQQLESIEQNPNDWLEEQFEWPF